MNLQTIKANGVVPEGFGTAIPSNPIELLKYLQQKQKEQHRGHHTEDVYEERLKKQDSERETYEAIQMDQEDIISGNLVIIYKEHDQEKLRNKIKKDIEARQALERAEREARRKAAEERRVAVVERIRKQKEMEELRKREAEMALVRIEEEKLRKIQEEKNRFLDNQTQMVLEDQLSMLVEQEYREYLERKVWQARERERLLEWEKEQKKKDQLEEEARKERMKELEEKKKKLELLRQQQQQQRKSNESSSEQGEKLNKNLRIQNRAKFVSKKIATINAHAVANNGVELVEEIINHNSSSSQIDKLFPQTGSSIEVSSQPVSPSEETGFMISDETVRHPELRIGESRSIIPPIKIPLQRNMSTRNLDSVIFHTNSTATPSHSYGNADSHHSLTNASVHPVEGVATLHRQSSLKLGFDKGSHYALPLELQRELESYAVMIKEVESELQLKSMHQDLMMRKRELRLEHRKKMTFGVDGNCSPVQQQQVLSPIPSTSATPRSRSNNVSPRDGGQSNHHSASLSETMNRGLKEKLFLVTEKMKLIDHRLTEFSKVKSENFSSKNNENEKSKLLRQQSVSKSLHSVSSSSRNHLIRSPEDGKKREENSKVGIAELNNELLESPSHQAADIIHQQNDLFKQCENVLRNATKAIVRSGDLSASSRSTDFRSLIDEMTSGTLEVMKYSQLLSKDYDPLGYIEKLRIMNENLQSSIHQLQDKQKLVENQQQVHSDAFPESKSSSRPLSSGSSRRKPVKIFSKSNLVESDETSRKGSPRSQPSLSESRTVPLIPTKEEVNSKLVASSSEPIIVDQDAKVISVTKDNLSEALMNEKEPSSETKEKEDKDEEINPAEIPGWDECIYTSMFSAAHHAAFFGYVEVLSFLCKYFDCFIMDKKGRTPLFYASLNNRLDCVAVLLALDPQWIDVGDEKGDTALHAATISNSIQVLAFLLSCEAHPGIANYNGLTPPHLAKSVEILELLFNGGAQLYCVDNLSRTPLWYCCSDNRLECCEYLCDKTPIEFLLWKDNDGETPLHIASIKGNDKCTDILCQYILSLDDLSCSNSRKYTAAHLAANANVLQVLYENGANLWIKDEAKGRMPLFIASFFGRADCVSFLLDLANKKKEQQQQQLSSVSTDDQMNSSIKRKKLPSVMSSGNSSSSLSLSVSTASNSPFSPTSPAFAPLSTTRSVSDNIFEGIKCQDIQGDTALHVAALTGHISCVHLLLFYLSNNVRNKQNLRPSDLAMKANHSNISQLIENIEKMKTEGNGSRTESSEQRLTGNYEMVFGTNDFNFFSSVILYYGSRWGKSYDMTYQSYYYIDYITNQSQWERPLLLDLGKKEEDQYTKACDLLLSFYGKYNPDKIAEVPSILVHYRGNYTNLFINLANKYQIKDLSMFSGISFD
jgi:ankyrin repeat protein